jgi:hypothetical protein
MKNSNFKQSSIKELRQKTNRVLKNKYKTAPDTYNVKVIDEIIYNESTRLVAVFKDFLLFDDSSEFLRR